MNKTISNAGFGIIKSRCNLFLKPVFAIALFLAAANCANAQHCDGCNVNINGPTYIHVGDTVTFTVTPSMPYFEYSVAWDQIHFLDGIADIIDQGKDLAGDEYIVLYFHSTGSPWFTYSGSYSGFQDFDELALQIVP
jgi:hypothetical protein